MHLKKKTIYSRNAVFLWQEKDNSDEVLQLPYNIDSPSFYIQHTNTHKYTHIYMFITENRAIKYYVQYVLYDK